MIPYGRQQINEADIAAVVAVMRSDWLTQGPAVAAFENEVAARCQAAHAVAVCNATAALHMACQALGVGPGDRVWTSPNTFVASANCARYCGADVDFVDVDPATWNMSVGALAEKLAAAATAGKLPKAVIPVHFAGLPCDMADISVLAKQYGFRVIEDASHAIGARYMGEPVGSGQYSDITVFSFHPVKIITTGEGGMALTNDPKIAANLRRLRSHGITRDQDEMDGVYEGPWYYQQVELGANSRMTDLQAALGSSQLKRLDGFVARRTELVQRYDELLRALPVRPQARIAASQSAHHLYVVCLTATPSRRKQVFVHMMESGIGVNVHYIPVHLQPYYRRRGFNPGDFPNAEGYYEQALTLPLHPGLSFEDQDTVVRTLAEAVA